MCDDLPAPGILSLRETLLAALSTLVGKPVDVKLETGDGPGLLATGHLFRVHESDAPWETGTNYWILLENRPDGSRLNIDCDELQSVAWTSPLQIELLICFEGGYLVIRDRSAPARMLYLEVQVGKALAQQTPPEMRARTLWLLTGMVQVEADLAIDSDDQERLRHLLAFLDAYQRNDDTNDNGDDDPPDSNLSF